MVTILTTTTKTKNIIRLVIFCSSSRFTAFTEKSSTTRMFSPVTELHHILSAHIEHTVPMGNTTRALQTSFSEKDNTQRCRVSDGTVQSLSSVIKVLLICVMQKKKRVFGRREWAPCAAPTVPPPRQAHTPPISTFVSHAWAAAAAVVRACVWHFLDVALPK